MQVERDQRCGAAQHAVEHEGNLHAANRLAQTESVAANAFGDDDTFIEVPALGVSGKHQHQLGVVFHAAETFFAAEHEPHIGRLERDLAFARLKEVAGDRSYLIKLDRLKSCNDVGPASPVDTQSGKLSFKGGEQQTAYNRAKEEEWQHA